MNLALSDEQVFLREAARGALDRFKTVEAAREALDGGELPDLWPAASEAGWPGLMISSEHGGAGLGAFDAMLVLAECGRKLAPVPLLGHVPATAVLDGGGADAALLKRLAEGDARAVYVPARPPDDIEDTWTVEPARGVTRVAAPTITVDGESASVSGEVAWVPDAPGADVLVVVGVDGEGKPRAVVVDAGSDGVSVEPVTRYDATRSLGHVKLDNAAATPLEADDEALTGAWYLAQALLAAEALGAVEEALERSVEYAKERFTFGRAIGSYQAVKHSLVEVLRRMENLRSLLYYAGWSHADAPDEFPLAASAARAAAGRAFDYTAREFISVHGGIGATWEHDAPLYFRRAQLSRRLLGGAGDATDRVAGEVLRNAA
ncbi:MAG TPA: acyl-CoA dehydrogenase family protein [Solirubrobacteraceae bacterium]|nr:acyl-CoA dehydrogenase family protein [Solirubrobacteraceae bacterium]